MDLEQLEALAFGAFGAAATDRAAALATLLPGTAIHDYWRGVHLQHAGALDEVDAMLATWRERHADQDDLLARLGRRQLLLRAGGDLAAHADEIRRKAGLTFDDQAEAEAEAQRFPSRLDPALVDGAALVREGMRRALDLEALTDWALPELVAAASAGKLEVTSRRHLVRRLPRANLPGVVALVADELYDPSSRGFGSLPIQRLLTVAQLAELGSLRPSVCEEEPWVEAVVTRLRPPDHVDWETDLGARRAYLDGLERFVATLAPSFNGWKALVLQHQLDLDRRLGAYDRARFLRYLELPRQAPYVEPAWLRQIPESHLARVGDRASASTGLRALDDAALVRDHLAHHLAHEEEGAFAERLRRDWLRTELATARLLAGDPDVARWARLLPEGALAALRDRVDIDLSPRNPARFGAGDPVALEVFVKNVPELAVKVFRIDVLACFAASGQEVDTGVDLDGMVAGDERTLTFDAPPIQRIARRIELPACARPGTYVVELIGNGRSSRALIRKGGLRHTVRTSAAGPTVRVHDDAGRPLPDARVWMSGRELTPRDDGEVSLPFSTQPGPVPVLLLHGEVAQREVIHLPAERYTLTAGLHLEREALVPGHTARLLLRPTLEVAGTPAPLALVEEPRVEITVTDLAGTTSTRVEPVLLHDDAETVVSLRVPEDATRVAVWLRGRVRMASTQQTVDVADGAGGPHNLVHEGPHTELLYLATTDLGHVLHVLGKTGEARAGRAVTLAFAPVAVAFEVHVTLGTDERGRIELGHLPGVARVTAVLPSGVRQTWSLWPEATAPSRVHVEEGAVITLPAPPGAASAEGDLAAVLSLTEQRGGAPARDVTSHVRLERRALVITDLAPGTYALSCRSTSATVTTIRVAPASPISGAEWSTAGPLMLELSPPLPLIRELSVDGSDLVARLSDAGPATRVHLLATTFRPDPVLPRALGRAARSPLAAAVPPLVSHYVSGRDIGDEQRYVIERRSAARRPGVLVDKPSLLLDPWALRTTTTAVQTAAAGTAYGISPARPASPAAAAPAQAATEDTRTRGDDGGPGLVTFDFLAGPAVVLENLRPDAEGLIRVPRGSLGPAQLVRAVVVDPALTTSADFALPETATPPRDRRLRTALDPARHFAEERRVDGVTAGTVLVVDDLRSGKLDVDTLARAHTLLLSLGGDDALREFSFVAQWPLLDPAAQRGKYSKYACHELNLFLFVKDPAFFAAVVRPHLANRRRRTFVDRWLLGEDLTSYLEPWAFGRLNTLEKILLARHVPAVRDAVARLVGDAVDLIPPDPERDARLVDNLLGAAALEEGGAMDHDVELSEPSSDVVAAGLPTDRAHRLSQSKSEPPRAGGMAGAPPPLPASRPSKLAKSAGPGSMGGGGRGGADRALADVRERGRMEALYRGADRTEEWAETGYRRRRIEEAGPRLIGPNRFWRDLATHREGPFLSPHLGECAATFAEAMIRLAFLDLPFAAGPHDSARDDVRLTFTAASHALVARTRLVEVDVEVDRRAPGARTPLVGQSYFRADDRWDYAGAERREKYVTGELVTGVVYQCQVVITNPSSASERLDVLLQIPRGAVPVSRGFLTRTLHLHLGPYGTHALEYAFYFPEAGRWTHFPAHVTRSGALAAFAEPRTLDVVRVPSTVDAGSWAHVSQHGSTDEVLAFLQRENLGRVDLARVAWRMRDAEAFRRVTALLAARRVYHDRLWAYGLVHADRERTAEWLRHQDPFVKLGGPVLEGALADLDPEARGWYQHLEYAPLVNARTQKLGRRRRILNDALDAQYRAFLDVVAHRTRPTDDDRLAAAHYLFALDRQDEALACLSGVRRERIAAPMPYDYLAAYAACCRGDLAAARRLAAPWLEHPVDRWRLRFAQLTSMLDEAESTGLAGAGAHAAGEASEAATGPAARDRQMAELAARQPVLELVAERGALLVQHHHLASCQVRFHRLDVELYFSRQPFLQGDVERFSWIEPGHVLSFPLGEGGRTPVPIPAALSTENLVVEARAGGLRVSAAHYAHDLAVHVAHTYGQLRVLRASTQAPLPAVYVKVYARNRGGEVAFYKDGYTDVRGRFDYATLSTDDLDRVERFALLVAADDAGATVLEAPPPQR